MTEWRRVSGRWFLHRAEPLLHERMWGCALPAPPGESAWYDEGGFDAAGRPIARRSIGLGGEVLAQEVAVVEDGAVVLRRADRVVARTVRDDAGRPIRTEYAGGEHDERYEYDDAGRLVTIHESPELWLEAGSSPRMTSGGRLTVQYEGDTPVRIVGEHELVWEAPRTPWEEELRDGATAIATGCREMIARACREHDVPTGTEVFALCLTYVDQGGLHPVLSFGMEADRRRWREEGLDEEELAIKLLYIGGNGEGLNYVEDEVVPPAMDERLLRRASMEQPGDPHRAVLGEVARRLAAAPLDPPLVATDDFVVFIAEHDEGFAPKIRSIHDHNPPERVARWEASWPPGAPRGEDELE